MKKTNESTAPQIEVLEARIAPAGLFSGVGSGQDLKVAKFLDADGDRVIVKLKGGGKNAVFDITLDGNVKNRANIESISVENANENAKLRVTVKGRTAKFLADGIEFPDTRTLRFTEIGSIAVDGSIKAIALRGAAFDSVTVDGNLGSLSTHLRRLQYIDLELPGGLDPRDQFDLGDISVAGNLGAFSVRGRADFTNNLDGAITVGGNLGRIDAGSSNLNASLDVSGSIGRVTLWDLNGSALSGTGFGRLNLNGDFAGTAQAGDAGVAGFSITVKGDFVAGASATTLAGDLRIGTIGVAGVTGEFAGLAISGGNLSLNAKSVASTAALEAIGTLALHAGPMAGAHEAGGEVTIVSKGGDFSAHVVAPAINAGGLLTIQGGNFSGTMVATSGDLGGVKLTMPGAVFSGSLQAAFGAIGSVSSAGTISGANLLAGSSIGNLDARGDIEGSRVVAGGSLGHIISATGSIGGSSASPEEGVVAGNVFLAAAIGDEAGIGLQAKRDIAGNLVQTSVRDIGSIVAQTGRIAYSTFASAGAIGAISATSAGGSYSFDANGFLLGLGDPFSPRYSAIDRSVFVASDGGIGPITATASAAGGNAIHESVFAATGDIESIVANTYAPGGGGDVIVFGSSGFGYGDSGSAIYDSQISALNIGSIRANSHHAFGGDAIHGSVIQVFGSGIDAALGEVTAFARGGAGISGTDILAANSGIGFISGSAVNGNGIEGSTIRANSSSILGVSGFSSNRGHGIVDTNISAGFPVGLDEGGLGFISGVAKQGTGILESEITAAGGGITGVIGRSEGVGGGDGIAASRVFTSGSIGGINGISLTGHGITNTLFSADGSIGEEGTAVLAITSSTDASKSAIDHSIFRAGGDIGGIVAQTFVANAMAIRGTVEVTGDTVFLSDNCPDVSVVALADAGATIFSARGSIGDVLVARGDNDGAFFMAGYDIGGDMSFDGLADGDDFAGLDESVSIGDVLLGNGDIKRSAFVAGVATQDNVLGNGDDSVIVPGSSIGAITAYENGYITDVVIEADNVGAIVSGPVSGLNLLAPAGDFAGLNSVGAFPGGAAIENVTIRVGGNVGDITGINTAPTGGSGIYGLGVAAGGNIGNITGSTAGGNGGIEADGIAYACITAGGNVGNISASVLNPNGDDGIDNVSIHAGGDIGDTKVNSVGAGDGIVASAYTAGGSIGALVVDPVGDDGIDNSTFIAGGDIGDITVAEEGGPGAADDGIVNSYFSAGGNIGNVYAHTSGTGVDDEGNGRDGIHNSLFFAGGSIASITGISDGEAADDDGIHGVSAFAGEAEEGEEGEEGEGQEEEPAAGGANIGFITGNAVGGSGIRSGIFFATGDIGDVTGSTTGGYGIFSTDVLAGENIGTVSGIGGEGGIRGSLFAADSIFGIPEFEDGNGAIAAVRGTATDGHGIAASQFIASSGIGAGNPLPLDFGIFGTAAKNGGGGIVESFFVADRDADGSGLLGNLAGTTDGTGSGIESSTFRGEGIGSITGSAVVFHGIIDSTFIAENGGIGAITGFSGSVPKANAIGFSQFRAAAGGMGAILAASAEGRAVQSSTFTAIGSIGNILLNGNVEASNFLAGVDTGNDFTLDGDDTFAAGQSIGTVTVNALSAAGFRETNIIASVQHVNGVYGDAGDVVLAGGSIGVIVINGVNPAGADAASSYAIQADNIADATAGGNVNAKINGGDVDLPFTLNGVRVRVL